eukprot:TRINITY_DN6016_c0_g1_i1.p1 TRINITY_DN6016_c0_g1~~TRINITY_DN6016_c0_g1_i1.p1  ORF type:complete len:404 (+),score=60.84 TRINITY_DN6016_c0_g1_i1:135-1346(+)
MIDTSHINMPQDWIQRYINFLESPVNQVPAWFKIQNAQPQQNVPSNICALSGCNKPANAGFRHCSVEHAHQQTQEKYAASLTNNQILCCALQGCYLPVQPGFKHCSKAHALHKNNNATTADVYEINPMMLIDMEELRRNGCKIEKNKDGVMHCEITYSGGKPPTGYDSTLRARLYNLVAKEFYAFYGQKATCKITKITAYFSPKLWNRFMKKRIELAKIGSTNLMVDCIFSAKDNEKKSSRLPQIQDQLGHLGELMGHYADSKVKDKSNPLMLWHATSEKAIQPIMETGFLLNLLGKGSGDQGFIGAGIYFTNSAGYGEAYLKPNQVRKLILSWVQVGKPYVLTKVEMGRDLEEGYHSHYAFVQKFKPVKSGNPHDGDEFCVFTEEQILPVFILEFEKEVWKK